MPDTAVGIYRGFVLRGDALINDASLSTFLNVATIGLSGQFETTFNTPMSDPDYWRAVRNIIGVETAVLMGYNGYSAWSVNRNPYSTEWMMQYSERMAGPAGRVPAGTFDAAFEISAADKAKLDGWTFRPDDKTYVEYKPIYDNPQYFDQSTGVAHWSANDGFVDGTQEIAAFDSSTTFMRIGGEGGSFLGNTTDTFEMRSLSPSSHSAEIHYYRPVTNIELTTGEVAPWFDCEGGGVQFVKYKPDGSMYSIAEMLTNGWLEEVPSTILTGE